MTEAKPRTLYQKLLGVQKAVQYFQKANKNQQQGFHYVSSSQVCADIRAAMDEEGLLLKSEIISSEARLNAISTKSGGAMHWTGLVMRFTWINADDPAEREECMWWAEGLDNSEKATGKAATYAEKYFLLKFFHVPTDKDDPDAWADRNEEAAAAPAPPLDVAPAAPPAYDAEGYPLTAKALAAWMADVLGITKEDLGPMRAKAAELAWGGPPKDWKALTPAQWGQLARALNTLVNGTTDDAQEAVA